MPGPEDVFSWCWAALMSKGPGNCGEVTWRWALPGDVSPPSYQIAQKVSICGLVALKDCSVQ